MELFERLFTKNRLYDMLVNLLCGIFTETTLFIGGARHGVYLIGRCGMNDWGDVRRG
jgi:hypothetical protein